MAAAELLMVLNDSLRKRVEQARGSHSDELSERMGKADIWTCEGKVRKHIGRKNVLNVMEQMNKRIGIGLC